MKSYRPYAPEQSYLLPPSPQEWLPPSHLVYFVLGFVEQRARRDLHRPGEPDHGSRRGYFSTGNVRAAEHIGTEPLISVGKHRNNGSQEELPAHYQTDARRAMRATLSARDGRAAYAKRKAPSSRCSDR